MDDDLAADVCPFEAVVMATRWTSRDSIEGGGGGWAKVTACGAFVCKRMSRKAFKGIRVVVRKEKMATASKWRLL